MRDQVFSTLEYKTLLTYDWVKYANLGLGKYNTLELIKRREYDINEYLERKIITYVGCIQRPPYNR